MQDFRALKVWEKSHRFVLKTYQATQSFPDNERYRLTSQIRRSSTSIPMDLAEGCGRRTDKDLAYFCDIAMGSASESEYQLMRARDLAYIDPNVHQRPENQLQEVTRMLRTYPKTEENRG